MAGRSAEVKVTISGDAKGATRAAGEASKAVSGLEKSTATTSSKITQTLGQAFSGTKIGSSLSRLQGTAAATFGGIGQSAAGLGAMMGPAIVGGVALAGGAIAKFALDGVGKFETVALAAGKFADSTGLNVEMASRYLEASDQLGIGAETMQNAFAKMEKALNVNRGAFGDLVATTKTGEVDLNQTFQNVITHIQGIQDPLQKATESSKLFGKGFTEISEILQLSAGDLQQALNDVDASKLITPEDLTMARNYRDAMDEFHDSIEKVQIQLGQKLIPVLTGAADFVRVFLSGIDAVTSSEKDATTATQEHVDAIHPEVQAYNDAVQAQSTLDAKTQHFIGIQNDFTGSTKAVTEALKAEAGAARDLLGTTTDLDRAQIDFIEKNEAVAKARLEAAKGGKDQIANERALRLAYDDAKDAATRVADATLATAKAHAAATGSTLTAEQENRILADSYRFLAGTQTGPVADALRGTAFLLDLVGNKNATPKITIDPKPAKTNINDVQRAADALDKMRFNPTVDANIDPATGKVKTITQRVEDFALSRWSTTIDADANPAIAAIQRAIRLGQIWAGSTYTADINTRRIGAFAEGGVVPGPIGKPQAAIVHGGEIIIPAGKLNPPTGGGLPKGIGGNTYYFTITGAIDPVSTAKQIKSILAAGERAGVR